MPQMSPMWWLTLMIMFNIIMIMMNSYLYFLKNKEMTYKKSKMNKMNWKW